MNIIFLESDLEVVCVKNMLWVTFNQFDPLSFTFFLLNPLTILPVRDGITQFDPFSSKWLEMGTSYKFKQPPSIMASYKFVIFGNLTVQ